jgi:hypothetical protein
MKLKIQKNSPITITKWKTCWSSKEICIGKVSKIKHGIVIDAIGDTINVKHTIFKLGFIKLWYTKWYSFSDKHYNINVKGIQ